MPDAKQVRSALEAYIKGWETADREAWLSLFSQDAVLIDPVGSDPHEALRPLRRSGISSTNCP